jgi:hypothetical protein
MTLLERMLNPKPRWVPRDARRRSVDLLGCTWVWVRPWCDAETTALTAFEDSLFVRFDDWLWNHRATRLIPRLWWRKVKVT